MKSKLISADAQRTYAVILDTGEEAVSCLTAFAKEHRLSASQFTALGAFRDCVLGYFDWDKKDYTRIPIAEQVEVLALAHSRYKRQRRVRGAPASSSVHISELVQRIELTEPVGVGEIPQALHGLGFFDL